MLKTHISACLLTTALLAAPALAQTSTTTTAPATPAPAGSTMSPNVTTSTSGTMASQGDFITQRSPGMMRASDLIGMDVRGTNNEDIGEVGDVLIDRSGQAQAVVIDVGGFLGIGETHVAVPMKSLQFRSNDRDATATGSVSTAPASGAAGQNNAATTSTTQNQAAANAGADNDEPDVIVLVMTKDQLKSAPKFEDNNRNANTGNTTGSTMGGTAPATGTTAPKQ